MVKIFSGNKKVLRAFMKILIDDDCLISTGNLFHSFEAATVKVLSLAKTLVIRYTRR